MKDLVFRNLYIFSISERLAKHIEFAEGLNVVTSNQKDGTDRGKSVIMRSLYHVLGADCYFKDNFDVNNKIFLLEFSFCESTYFIYRADRLFKFFNADKILLFSVSDRHQLAIQLKKYLGLALQLPNRSKEKLELAPPAFNYLLSYIDQDYYNGSTFSSFDKLGQFAKFKENVIYYALGVIDENYYRLTKLVEDKTETIRKISSEISVNSNTLDYIRSINSVDIESDFNALKVDIEKQREEYEGITNNLSNTRNKLVTLRNQKYEFENRVSQLKKSLNSWTEICNSASVCPICKSRIQRNIADTVSAFSSIEDLLIMINSVEEDVIKIDTAIHAEESLYKEYLEDLAYYESILKDKYHNYDDIMFDYGCVKIKDNLMLRRNACLKKKEYELLLLERYKEELNSYKEKHVKINKRYSELLKNDSLFFNVKEIDKSRFNNIKYSFNGSGSNNPIYTIMWYMTLNKLRNEFNPNSIRLPMVIDSPHNKETDDDKKEAMYKYIDDNKNIFKQIIVASIGFESQVKEHQAICIIKLTNDKQHLLNAQDYETYKSLLIQFG